MAHLNESVPCSLKASVSAAYYLSWGYWFFYRPAAHRRVWRHAETRVGVLSSGALNGGTQLLSLDESCPNGKTKGDRRI